MSDATKRRLFLAVEIDAETKALLGAHLDANGLDAWPGRVVPPANWHITLRFLGWTSDLQRDLVLRSLAEASLPGSFRLRFGHLGAFPKPRRATVTWIGVPAGAEELGDLAAAAESAARDAGFTAEERPYHPHLTLSRVRPAVDVRELVDRFPAFDAAMRVDAVTMFESHLERGGARYEVLDRVGL